MKKRKANLKKAKAPSIVVDGVSYKIPRYLSDLPKDQLEKVIRGWRPEQKAENVPMTAQQFSSVIAKLGLSQQKAGVFLGFSKRTGQRFALGEKPIPIAVVYLLSEMLLNKTSPEDLEKRFSKTSK